VEKYKSVARNEDEAQYFANVENVDIATGRLLKALESLDLRENTIVYFTADNGPETLKRYPRANRSYGSPGPLRGMKLWTTEAGFRVAGIINWPAGIKSPAVVNEPVSLLDLLPTFCQLAKRDLPPNRKFDGTNFLPALEGKPLSRENALFWCYFNALNEHRVAMRDGEWKLLAKITHGDLPRMENINDKNIERIRAASLSDFELYHVADDIGEKQNVIEQHPNEAAKLKQKREELYKELAATSHVWKTESPMRN
jgi:arylsulfatase A